VVAVAADQTAAVDGRALRRVRNQDAVVEAILDLLTEGHPQPTAHQIAGRSGVSMRSIFRLFEDMEALHRAAISRQVERVTAMVALLDDDGPVAGRVAALVDNRAEVFEAITPVRRFALRLAPQSPPIREELARAARRFREQLVVVFGPELDDAAQGGQLLEGLDVATSWETWDRLRTVQDLSPAQATATVAQLVTALLVTRVGPSGDDPVRRTVRTTRRRRR
jgi:TetR/AcrR family transcriptional regulator, regulator of autoinduction and epiphytic fitness